MRRTVSSKLRCRRSAARSSTAHCVACDLSVPSPRVIRDMSKIPDKHSKMIRLAAFGGSLRSRCRLSATQFVGRHCFYEVTQFLPARVAGFCRSIHPRVGQNVVGLHTIALAIRDAERALRSRRALPHALGCRFTKRSTGFDLVGRHAFAGLIRQARGYCAMSYPRTAPFSYQRKARLDDEQSAFFVHSFEQRPTPPILEALPGSLDAS